MNCSSNHSQYNFKPDSYGSPQRTIPLIDLAGLIVSSATTQLVIRVRSNYDYLVAPATKALRDQLIQATTKRFAQINQGYELTIHGTACS